MPPREEMPVTTPLPEPTDAIAGKLLAHVPPPASVKFVVDPKQTAGFPEIRVGNESTVTGTLVAHPENW